MKAPRKTNIPQQRLPWPKEIESLAFDLNSADPQPYHHLPKGMESLSERAFNFRMTFPRIPAPKEDAPKLEELIEKIVFSQPGIPKSSKEGKRKTKKGTKTTAVSGTNGKESGIPDSGKSIYWAKNPIPLTLQPYIGAGMGSSKKVLRAIKVRLYPNKTQQKEILNILTAYRYVYNRCLGYKILMYRKHNETLGLKELSAYFHGTIRKDSKHPGVRTVNTKVMKQAVRQVVDTFERFFTLHTGYPKFKRDRDGLSALFPREAISRTNKFLNNRITLTKNLKDLKFRCSDEYLCRLHTYRDSIRSATLSQDKSGKFFLSILVEMPLETMTRPAKTGRNVGIDLGVKDQFITSDGKIFENKHFSKNREGKISRLQRQLSRKEKGSKNWVKNRVKLAKAYAKATNQKEAYFHEAINELLSKYDVVCMEDLNVAGMRQNHRMSKALNDPCLGRFRELMVDKASIQGKRVVFVGRFFPSSKRCHRCGYIYKWLKLKDRVWTCPKCGRFHDRDMNSALDLKSEGERLLSEGVKEKEVRHLKGNAEKRNAEKAQGTPDNLGKSDCVKSQ